MSELHACRLPRMSRKGQWRCVYISQETIEEIRNLSKLPKWKRKKLGENLKRIIEQLKQHPPYKRSGITWRFYVKNERKKLKRNYQLSEQILGEAQKYFFESVQKRLSVGQSLDERFYASLYLAFRMLGIPKLLKDITEISGVSPKKLGKLYRLFTRELNLTVHACN